MTTRAPRLLPVTPRFAGLGALTGAGVFVAVVGTLHVLQPTYDFRRQLMSELAEGAGGWAMLPAFLSLTVSVGFVERGLAAVSAPRAIRILLRLAAIGFAGAGVWTLSAAPLLHVSAIAFAFVTLVCAMALLPIQRATTVRPVSREASWTLTAAAALSMVAAGGVISLAVAQRITAAAVLLWLMLIGWRLAHPRSP